MILKGIAYYYGDDISTDAIIPGPYLQCEKPEELASYAMKGCDPGFPQKSKGCILVVGKNFGCGSSREQAALCLKYAGVQAIVGVSFARIFYRNAINQGIPLLECPGILDHVHDGDIIKVHVQTGLIVNSSTKRETTASALPPFLFDIVQAGGTVPWFKKKHPTQ